MGVGGDQYWQFDWRAGNSQVAYDHVHVGGFICAHAWCCQRWDGCCVKCLACILLGNSTWRRWRSNDCGCKHDHHAGGTTRYAWTNAGTHRGCILGKHANWRTNYGLGSRLHQCVVVVGVWRNHHVDCLRLHVRLDLGERYRACLKA